MSVPTSCVPDENVVFGPDCAGTGDGFTTHFCVSDGEAGPVVAGSSLLPPAAASARIPTNSINTTTAASTHGQMRRRFGGGAACCHCGGNGCPGGMACVMSSP